MFRVDVKNGYKLFSRKEDADNYKDYLANGLKLIGTSCGGWLFNDGSILFDITLPGSKDKNYSLHRDNQSITSPRLLKKYVALIS